MWMPLGDIRQAQIALGEGVDGQHKTVRVGMCKERELRYVSYFEGNNIINADLPFRFMNGQWELYLPEVPYVRPDTA